MSAERAMRGARGAIVDAAALRFFLAYYRRRAGALTLFVLAASAQSLLALPVLALLRRAFDVAIPARDATMLVWIGAAVLGVRALGSVIALAQRAWGLRLIKGVVAELRRDLVARLYRLSRADLGTADLTRLHTRIVQDTERVDQWSNGLLAGVLPALVSALVLLIALVALDWRLVVITVAVVPLLFGAGRLTGRGTKTAVRHFQAAFEGFSRTLRFGLRHLDLTRLKAYEREELARQHDAVEALRATGHRMAMSFAVHSQVQRTLVGLGGVTVLVAGGIAVAQGRLTLGQLVQFYVAAGLLNGYADTVLGALPELIAGSESLAKLRAIAVDGDDEPYPTRRDVAPSPFGGAVTFEAVSFGYGASDVLTDVSLELPRGANVVVTGVNGAGKSTLVHLLAGFYRPRRGRLLADGVPYDALDVRVLRRGIGVVPQHPLFFAGTARENVAYGVPDATDAQLAAAAALAGADALLARLATGWDTPVGDDGVLLSGGERQRLAIARALLGAPRLLVLDEPTTHLDAQTVEAVMRRLVDWPERPTLLTISHDPVVIACADVVYRIEGGRLRRLPPRDVHALATPAALAVP